MPVPGDRAPQGTHRIKRKETLIKRTWWQIQYLSAKHINSKQISHFKHCPALLKLQLLHDQVRCLTSSCEQSSGSPVSGTERGREMHTRCMRNRCRPCEAPIRGPTRQVPIFAWFRGNWSSAGRRSFILCTWRLTNTFLTPYSGALCTLDLSPQEMCYVFAFLILIWEYFCICISRSLEKSFLQFIYILLLLLMIFVEHVFICSLFLCYTVLLSDQYF